MSETKPALKIPSQEKLWELFSYDPDTGDLTNNRTGHVYGKRLKKNCEISPYILAYINNKPYKAHRIIWTMVHGPIPKGMTIDHINLDKRDNRLSNLRLATIRQQLQNRRAWSGSGLKGAHKTKVPGKFMAQITLNYKVKYLGTFDTAEEAAEVYRKEAVKYLGQFACTTSASSSA